MGNRPLARRRNDQIQKELHAARMNDAKQIKILLLGAGESGKSTIFKQLRLISGGKFSKDQLKGFRPKLVLNVVEGAGDMLRGMSELGIQLSSPESEGAAELIRANLENRELSQEVVDAILYLWDKDEAFRGAYERRSEFQLQDTWDYLVEKLRDFPKWGGDKWLPAVDDIIRARVRTSGIVDETFVFKRVAFRFFDVGGQRNERRKWIHSFENVTTIIWVVALQEYDQMLFEDATKNRLVEAKELFQETIQNEWFHDTPVILFLNKTDLFRKKLCEAKIPLNVSGLFPNAPDTFDYNEGLEWVKRFLLEGLPPKRNVFVFETCATDFSSIDKVFSASSAIILEDNLHLSGLVRRNQS